MAKQIVQLKIDVSKIDKKRLYEGKNGAKYLTATVFLNDEADQYGNNGMIVEQTSKEEREAGHKGTILGNAKIMGATAPQSKAAPIPADVPKDDLPF